LDVAIDESKGNPREGVAELSDTDPVICNLEAWKP
jgi:hypothetical protein